MTTFNRMGKYSQVIIVCIAGFGISATHADEIRLQTQSDFGQLDPAFWQSSADQTIIDAIFPKLIEFKSGSDWEWELSAAETIEQIDPLTINFTLKKGLMWTGDYGEVTAEDVEYSFERYSKHKFHSCEIRFLQSIASEQVPGILQIWQRAYLSERQKHQTQYLYTPSLHRILTFL